MLVHHKVPPPPSIKFVGTHLYTWVERGTVRVKCQEEDIRQEKTESQDKPFHNALKTLFYNGMSDPLLVVIDYQKICMDVCTLCFTHNILLDIEIIMHHTECHANCHGEAENLSGISQLAVQVPLEIFIYIHTFHLHILNLISRLNYGNTILLILTNSVLTYSMVKFYSGSCILKASIVDCRSILSIDISIGNRLTS